MEKRSYIRPEHPLRRLFRRALDFGFSLHHPEKEGIEGYLEEQVLCEFIHADNLYKIRDGAGRRLEDIAEMLAEGDVLLNAPSFQREFQVHKHIGDYTLFMLGMFPNALFRRRGREVPMGSLVLPGGDLYELYEIQGRRSYRIAAEFADTELYEELSQNFMLYRDVLELVKMYLESVREREYLKARRIIGGTD